MQIRIMAEGDEHALTSLESWLQRDPGTSNLTVTPVTGEGPTMGFLEALDIVLSNTADWSNFAIAYATWRATRNNTPASGARILSHGGSSVDISHLSPEELADLLRRLDDGVAGSDSTE
jgi:hypothetical protein